MEHPAVDPEPWRSLQQAAAGDTAFLLGLLDLALEDTPRRLASLAAAAGEGDATRSAALAHGLVARAGMLGLVELQAACRDLDGGAASLGREGLVRAAVGVQEAFDAVRGVLSAERERLRGGR